MNVLIYEPDPNGHRFTAVRMLLDALQSIEAGASIAIALASTRAARDTEEFALQLAPVAGQFEFIEVDGFADAQGARAIAVQKVRTLAALVLQRRFDHLYIPYADGMLQMLGVMRLNPRFQWPKDLVIEALLMRGGFAYPKASRIGGWVNSRALVQSGAARIHWIDPLPAQCIEQRYPALARISNLMPDPTPYLAPVERGEARAALQLPSGRYIGCVGRIDERKGMDRLIQAFARSALRDDDRLLLAGRHTDAVRAQIKAIADAQVRDRIISIDRYLDNHELLYATSAIDLMVTPYPAFVGSVSIVARAAMAGRLSLGTDYGWMGYVIPRFELGAVCSYDDQAQLERLLPEMLARSVRWTPPPVAQALLDFMGRRNVLAHWSALLRERLGKPAPVAPLAWPGD